MIKITQAGSGFIISVKAVPNAKKTQLAGEYNGALKVKVAAVPEDGKANDEIVDYFSEVFDINRSQIEIVKGFKSRHKVIKLTGIEEEKFKKILA